MARAYQAVTLREWCDGREKPFIQIAWPRRMDRRVRPIPGYQDAGYAIADFHSPEIFCGYVHDAQLMPGSSVVCTSDGFLIRERMHFADQMPLPGVGYLGKDQDRRYVIEIGAGQVVDHGCVFIGGAVNFGHFILESLLRLAVLEWAPALKALPVVVYDDLPDRFYEALVLLGYPHARRIEVSRNIPLTLKSAWFVSAPAYHAGPAAKPELWPESVWALRTRLAYLFKPSAKKRLRLFLPRGNAKWRRLVNESAPEMQALWRKFDITPVVLHELSVADQIAVVANAELIVTAPGAGSQITTFAPLDCAIVEIASPNMTGLFGPLAMAVMLDQPYFRFSARPAAPGEAEAAGLGANPSTAEIDRDYAVDVAPLDAVLQAAERYCRR